LTCGQGISVLQPEKDRDRYDQQKQASGDQSFHCEAR
jgi:hypothetical protein